MSLTTDLWRAVAHPRGTWSSAHRWADLARAARVSYADIMRYRRELKDNEWFQTHLAQSLPKITYSFPEAAEVYTVIRAVKPAVVLETGVASGLSSAHILLAMAKNHVGTLYSVDLPNVQQGSVLPDGRPTGWIVPADMRARWTLQLGDARQLLPQVLRSLLRIDLFLHGSDHSYEHMMFEFELVRPRLAAGAVLMSDDTHLHTAWDDFCARHGFRPARVGHLGITRTSR